ncbi:hypothetical protein GCM10023196_093190 [Actinoallomurus vinaceus]|uniref:Uncharacterized protein n=1 Tax=Actinoallomurus vinaceus TaxID=1080074 RepID=A0ABP8UTJ9_9ACTN
MIWSAILDRRMRIVVEPLAGSVREQTVDRILGASRNQSEVVMGRKKAAYRVMSEPNDPRFVDYGIPISERPVPGSRETGVRLGLWVLGAMVTGFIAGN